MTRFNNRNSDDAVEKFWLEYFKSVEYSRSVPWKKILEQCCRKGEIDWRSKSLATAVLLPDEIACEITAQNSELAQTTEFFYSSVIPFVEKNFPPDLLARLMISWIWIMDDYVLFSSTQRESKVIPYGDYIAPAVDFMQILVEHPELGANVYRAWSFVSSQALWVEKMNKHIPTPIILFNNTFDTESRSILKNENNRALPYLQGMAPEEKVAAYRLGHIAHEIWHHWYQWVIKQTPELLAEWTAIVASLNTPITPYSAEHLNAAPDLYLNESMAEFFRIFWTNEPYTREFEYCSKIESFIKKSGQFLLPPSTFVPKESESGA